MNHVLHTNASRGRDKIVRVRELLTSQDVETGFEHHWMLSLASPPLTDHSNSSVDILAGPD